MSVRVVKYSYDEQGRQRWAFEDVAEDVPVDGKNYVRKDKSWVEVVSSPVGGLDGKSAYEIAVLNGFVGTEPEWLLSLKGQDGIKGDKGDQGIQGPAGVGINRTVLTLGADSPTAANVTPIVLSGMVFNYEANSKYEIRLYALVKPTAGTTGCGFQFDLSSAVTRIGFGFYHQLANTGTLSGGHSIADNVSVGVSSGMPGTSTYPVEGQGILITGVNAGTAQLMFRSETTAVTACMANTIMIVEKVA